MPFVSKYDSSQSAKFTSSLVIGLCQSVLSTLSSFIYIMLRRKPGSTLRQNFGLDESRSIHHTNGNTENGHGHTHHNGNLVSSKASSSRGLVLAWSYFRTSLLITAAAPFGFAALAHISYPTMVLGKSCKLVPVLIMNVLLYRRRFAPHKYLVVAMVTAGITMFMFFGSESAAAASKHASKASQSGGGSNFIGLLYLLINLALDGTINSTQDEIFSRHKVTGQQMMFFINLFGSFISLFLASLPLPYIPVLHPSHIQGSELANALKFIESHPGVIKPLVQFAFTGALGQLFIFETLQHFGSLTLV